MPNQTPPRQPAKQGQTEISQDMQKSENPQNVDKHHPTFKTRSQIWQKKRRFPLNRVAMVPTKVPMRQSDKQRGQFAQTVHVLREPI
jgi:hypothetical protein